MNNKWDKDYLYATAALVSTVVGVGVFGIPFAFAKAGFFVGLLFLFVVGGLTLLANLMLGEVVLRSGHRHQVVGYTGDYLGEGWKTVMFFSFVLATYGALLAYVIIAGEFLNNIFSGWFYISSSAYSYGFFIVCAILVMMGLKAVASVEFVLSIAFIAIIFIIFGFGVPQINLDNYKTFMADFWFLPYGVLIFAFSGMPAIPIQRVLLKGKEHKLKSSIGLAMAIVTVLYLVFAATVVGVSGDLTSPDALSGLFDFLGPKIVILSSVLGLLCVGTSFLILGLALRDVFQFDYHVRRALAWLLVVAPPFFLFYFGLRAFIDTISLVGSLAIGLELVLVVMMYAKAKSRGSRIPEFSMDIPRVVLYFIMLFFGAGIVYALI